MLFSTLIFLRETQKKCNGNCLTANELCWQLRTRWCRGSRSTSSEKGKIMEQLEKLQEKRWRNPRDNPGLMTSPQHSINLVLLLLSLLL